MRRSVYVIAVSTLVLSLVWPAHGAYAVSLKIAPLEYRTTLNKDEKKKGYVDISNPSTQALNVNFEVQAFRQIDDLGGVEFYDDKDTSAGVLLDLKSTDLGPHEVIRLYFLIDGAKLPSGEVYAAILAHTVPGDVQGATQSVRVGTILEIVNNTPGAHKASVSDFSTPFFQVGDRITARFVVNSEDSTESSAGFRPPIDFRVVPYSEKKSEGPLVFAGHSRTVEYELPGNYFGPVWLQAGVEGSNKGAFSFVMTGYWRWLGPMMIVAVVSPVLATLRTRRKKH